MFALGVGLSSPLAANRNIRPLSKFALLGKIGNFCADLSANSEAISSDMSEKLADKDAKKGRFNEQMEFRKRSIEEVSALEMRSQTLRAWDRLLSWAFSNKPAAYILQEPIISHSYQMLNQAILEFEKEHGYFSPTYPLVGCTSKGPQDLIIAQQLLKDIHRSISNTAQKSFSTDEALAKVVAYRDLKVGMELSFSTFDELGESHWSTYIVDEIIDLWHGMPAFGLLPKQPNGGYAIILFRGTDLSLTTQRGWASILSDLDLSGPGHVTFLRSQEKIEKWLKRALALKTPAKAVGVSLGGAFVCYTAIHFPHLISSKWPSVAINSPGISEKVFNNWEELSNKNGLLLYVTRGDLVSKIGTLPGAVWQLSIDRTLGVIESHATMVSAHKHFSIERVNVKAENASRLHSAP